MSPQTRALEGKVAIVTGAASGIGKEIAFELARAGAAVAIADLNARRRAGRRGGDRRQRRPGDGHRDGRHRRGRGRGRRRPRWSTQFGGVDILVSNAGIQIVNPIEQFAYADWKKMLAIHLDGAFLTTKAVLPHMYGNDADGKSRGGTVIYMGSVHSHLASPLKSAYVTAKHGLLGLSRTLAKEGAKHGVRSHVVCPGFVRTPLVDKQIPEQARELGISEDEVVSQGDARQHGRRHLHHGRGRGADRALPRRIPERRVDRPELRGQPRLAHAVAAQRWNEPAARQACTVVMRVAAKVVAMTHASLA